MSDRSPSGGVLALWGVALTLLVGSLTVLALVVVRGGPQTASASGVVVDAPMAAQVEEAEVDDSSAVEETVDPVPVGWKSVLAPEVGFYRVQDYSYVEVLGHLQPTGTQVLASNADFDVILGDRLVSSALVYDVEVADRPADGDLEAAWTVTMRFADARALADATSDLGCQQRPDNMIAVASGGELLILASLEEERFCGIGFDTGRIRWQSFYGDRERTSEEARAIADGIARGLLGS